MAIKHFSINEAEDLMREKGYDVERKNAKTINCSCPICKEGSSAGKKKRFYILSGGNALTCFCHNCGYKKSFYQFMLTQHNENIFKEKSADDVMNSFMDSFNTPNNSIETIGNTIEYIEEETSIPKEFIPITKKGIAYAKSRLVPEFIYKDWYEDKNSIVIPFYNDEKLIGFQKRNMEYKSFYNEKLTSQRLFFDTPKTNSGFCIITEGVFNATSFYEAGYQAKAILGKNVPSDITKRHDIVYALDYDKAGINGAVKALLHNPLNRIIIFDNKDPNDIHTEDGIEKLKDYIKNSMIQGYDFLEMHKDIADKIKEKMNQ